MLKDSIRVFGCTVTAPVHHIIGLLILVCREREAGDLSVAISWSWGGGRLKNQISLITPLLTLKAHAHSK